MELALGIFVSPFHPGIIRESESNALSDLSRDFDTGGTPATVGVKYFWDFDNELALGIFCFPIPSKYNTRERK